MAESTLTRMIYRFRVRFGLLGLILAAVLSRADWISLALGSVITGMGLALRLWATGHLRKEKELTVSGPYRHTRNPLYLANLIIGIGIVAGTRSWWMVGIFAIYFLVFYPVIIRVERDKLRRLFPERYEEFSRSVPLFIPRLKPGLPRGNKRFSWQIYKRNHESRAAVAALVFWALLAAKHLLF